MRESGQNPSETRKNSRFLKAMKDLFRFLSCSLLCLITFLIIWAIIYPIYVFAISVSEDIHKSMKANGWFRGEYYEAPRNPPREFIKTRYH